MASLTHRLALVRDLLGASGIFLGFYFLISGDPSPGVSLVAMLAVGVVGLIAFLPHVPLHRRTRPVSVGRSARRTSSTNLAFAIAALIAAVASFGTRAEETVIIACAVYLLQAGLLHARLAAEPGAAPMSWSRVPLPRLRAREVRVDLGGVPDGLTLSLFYGLRTHRHSRGARSR